MEAASPKHSELKIPIPETPSLALQAFGDTGVITVLQAALTEGQVWFQLIFQQRQSKTETPLLTFKRLAEQWRKETRFISPVKRKVLHPAYQQIIGMGEVALPLILQDLEERPADWLWALRAIAGEDPASENGDFRQAIKAWVNWGKERGYI